MPVLEQKEYTVYTPMFSGHGTTNPEDILNQGIQQWRADAKAAIEFLKEKGYQKLLCWDCQWEASLP